MREIAEKAIEIVLSNSKGDHTEVSLALSRQGATRFANNAITHNQESERVEISVRVAFGNKVGSASINLLDERSIVEVVRRTEEIAMAAEPDTEYLPPPGPQDYLQTQCFSEKTDLFGPMDRAEAIRASIEMCESKGLVSAGSFITARTDLFIANSSGLRAEHRESMSRFAVTAISPDSSGWAESIDFDVTRIDPISTTRIAIEKAIASKSPKEIEPRSYEVILEPAAVAELGAFIIFSMDAKAAHEGRSPFTGKEGEKIGSELVTLRSDPSDPRCPSTPFLGDGMPAQRIFWIRNGVLENLFYSRFWAQKTGHPFTGMPTNLIMDGQGKSIEEMISSVKDGLLITRFWYIRFVEEMRLVLTGMTRDGVFKVEDGRIIHSVKNMRFNESMLDALSNVEATGREKRTGEYIPSLVPAIKISSFTFTSTTTF
jgi:predicted Zn-dependent protease